MLNAISSIIFDYIRSLLSLDLVIISFSAYAAYIFMQIVFHFVGNKRIIYK